MHSYELCTQIVESATPPILREHITDLQVVQEYFDTSNIAENYNAVKEKMDKALGEGRHGLLKTLTASSSYASISPRRDKFYEKHGNSDVGNTHMVEGTRVAIDVKDGIR